MVADGFFWTSMVVYWPIWIEQRGMRRPEWGKALSWKVWSFAFFLFASIYFSFIYFFLSFFQIFDMCYGLMGRCGNVSPKSTNSVTHRLLIFFFSLFTHEDSGKKKSGAQTLFVISGDWWMCERLMVVGLKLCFIYLFFGFLYYKIMVSGKIRDYWN